jgi:hypothetical protein
VLTLGGVVFGLRRWQIVHARPVVDPTTLAIHVEPPSSTSEVTEGARGQVSASYVTVRHDHPPTVEENP